MTIRLFDQDSYLRNFDSKVIKVLGANKKRKVVLEQTAFFPAGGGQSADGGTLNGHKVLQVEEKEGEIYHLIEGEIQEGDIITGDIFWEERFDKMQQHTGEHIVSGLVNQVFGYHNVGFHLGEELSTLDFNGELSGEQLMKIEDLANEAIYKNVEVEVLYPTKAELKRFEYRSKIDIEGQVRLVRIKDYDTCACCAPHVHKSGEIGIIKFVGIKSYKGGCRISMICGKRALYDYRVKASDIKSMAVLFSKKEHQVLKCVEQLSEEKGRSQYELQRCKTKLLSYYVNEILEKHVGERLCYFTGKNDGVQAREMVNLVLEKGIHLCAVFTTTNINQYRYVIGSNTVDVKKLGNNLCQQFAGTGGGSTQMIQGMVSGEKKELQDFVINYQTEETNGNKS